MNRNCEIDHDHIVSNDVRYYDAFGRDVGYALNGTRQSTLAYDAATGRLATMRIPSIEDFSHHSPTPTLNSNSFTWSYLAGSDLKSTLTYPNGLTASWQYDANNQLLQVKNATPANVISQFDYTYDAAGRRTAITRSGTAFGDLSDSVDSYAYNARSELTSARRTKNGQPIPGFSEDFDYDPIGNRRSSSTYNEKGEAQTSTYAANQLNQYTSRTTPGYAAVRGEADPNAFVTVDENPAFRFGSYFFGSDIFDNSRSERTADLLTYATLAQTAASGNEAEDLVSAEANKVYIPAASETFAYDDDGNQTLVTTSTGRWQVTYNGENRPVRWVRDSDNTTLVMSYDHMGRRRTKNAQRFFYDEYLQIVDNGGNAYIWDCTESVATRPLAWLRADSSELYAHDGNKNVSDVIAADGSVSAHYEYAPFGAVIMQRGESAAFNPFRFSSEYADDELGCVYYNYRHYEPVAGRWLSRDPIEEEDASNLFVFANNYAVGDSDVLGMFDDKFVCVKSHYEYKVVMEAPGRKRRTRVKVCDQYVVVDSEFPGHSKFSNNGTKCPFDYTLEDRSWWSRPENLITGTWRHFRAKDKIAGDLDDAIEKCNAMKFQRYMHQYQDTFVHSDKGYSWPWTFGHLPDSLRGKNPDNDKAAWEDAEEATKEFLTRWNNSCQLCDENKCRWVRNETIKKER